MKDTEYNTFNYEGREYINFVSVENKYLFFKKKVVRFIPTKTMISEKGDMIKKWKISMFPTQINKFNKYRCINGENKSFKDDFEDRYPNILMYLADLNNPSHTF